MQKLLDNANKEDFRLTENPLYFTTMIKKVLFLFLVSTFFGCEKEETTPKTLQLLEAFSGSQALTLSGAITEGIPLDAKITLVFSSAVDPASANTIQLKENTQPVVATIHTPANGSTVTILPAGPLEGNTVYTVDIPAELRGANGERFSRLEIRFKTEPGMLKIVAATSNETDLTGQAVVTDVPLDLSVYLNFSSSVNRTSLEESVTITGPNVPTLTYSYSDGDRSVMIRTASPLRHLTKFGLDVAQGLKGARGEPFAGFSKTLYTRLDPAPKMPLVSDDELLTIVQQHTFKYFWDFAHPTSGMARERNTSGDIVTSGGSGFGIMALIVGVERGFISRDEALGRMDKILTFLETADRFHGAWPHWLNGNTGKVIPFSPNDNGGDLVETSFLVQGLLTFRQYLNTGIPEEKNLIDRMNVLWESVEWDWYTKDGDVLYWHWSPDKQWIMNHPVRGYNEALITYFLAAASPGHTVDASVYHAGWAGNGAIINNKTFYGISLPLGYDYGGPLFFAHYSFLGLDPRGLQDTYANYWTQNVNHSLINHAHAVINPKQFVGYSDENWGFTASDNHLGYSAHSPTNDLGVIAPTAALSSFPYTPEQSMKALKFFYYSLGDRLWGPYGFYDAFNITEGWTADSYLAIDQGPIIVMIENYRTGLLWDLFMSAPEVQTAMDKLGFTR